MSKETTIQNLSNLPCLTTLPQTLNSFELTIALTESTDEFLLAYYDNQDLFIAFSKKSRTYLLQL